MRRRVLGHFSLGNPHAAALPFEDQTSLAEKRLCWARFLRQSPFAREVGIHVHIPFCLRRCTYCDCSSSRLRQVRDLSAHVDKLMAEMVYLEPVFRATRPRRFKTEIPEVALP